MIVYLATNTVNGMQYVGATIDFEKRVRAHVRAGQRGKGRKGSLAKAIKKFGDSAFCFEKIDKAKSLSDLSHKEAGWISELNTLSPNGYNLLPSGYSPAPKKVQNIKVGGVTYPSFAEAVRRLRPMPLKGAAGGHPDDRPIGEKAVKERIDSGWTVDQAFGVSPPPAYREGVKYCKGGKNRDGKGRVVKGQSFESVQHAADHYRAPLYRTKARLQRGWTIEEALGLEPRNHKNARYIEIKVEGKTFKNIKAACDFYGLNESVVRGRLNSRRNKWTVEEAFEIVEKFLPHPNLKPIVIDGKEFEGHKHAARFYGINYGTLYSRMESGYTPEQAVGIEPKPVKKHHAAKEITVFGGTYPSIDEACRQLAAQNGLFFNTVKGRLHRGWSIEDAVTKPVVNPLKKKETT
jgi:hypothetical protein